MPYNPIPDEWIPKGNADLNGDVILLLNASSPGQQVPLKVSSQVMSRASAVFKAMFDPRFTGRARFSPADPLEVRLEEDDCQAAIWLCFGLHDHDLPEGRMPLSLLKVLAIMVDKYDCAKAMQPWSRLWLLEWNDSLGYGHQWELLWISYALQDYQSFWTTSKRLTYDGPLKIPNLEGNSSDSVGISLLPTGLIGE